MANITRHGPFGVTDPFATSDPLDNLFRGFFRPVQMDKEGKNILEVRFRYPGFRVFEVSAMAQVPIIRKN